MKFAGVFVLFAVVLGIECSIIPYAPLSYTAVSGPTLVAAAPGAYAVPAAYAAPAIATIRGPAAGPVIAGPTIIAAAPAPAIVAAAPAVVAPAVVAAQGSYVAQTRGAVHVAPLAGHANSAASINLQPAPGTV